MKKSTSKKKTAAPAKKAAAASAPTKKSSLLNIDALQEALEFMKQSGLAELEYRVQGTEISLKFRDHGAAPVAKAAVPAAAPIATPAPAPTAPAAAKSDKKTIIIESPFVGTFYRAPGPNQDNFVEVGQIVDKNQPLCIIEAMKLMNEIESDTKGRIVKVLVDNATPVEFGEGLFEIEPL